jgi:alkylation response protein AidB-like acyl-CoA dehydrogenase
MVYREEHLEIRRTWRKIIDQEIQPQAESWEKTGIFPEHDVFKKLGTAGLLSVTKPVAYSGMGLDDTCRYAMAALVLDDVRGRRRAASAKGTWASPVRWSRSRKKRMWAVAASLVPLDRAISDTIAYTGQRVAFGRPLLDQQWIHFRWAELATEVEPGAHGSIVQSRPTQKAQT